MLIVHDLAEVVTGDLSPLGTDGTGQDSHLYNKEKAKEKFDGENAAAKKIFGVLPPELAKELYGVWMEYEKQECYEAKIVKAVDKLEGKLQAAEYAKGNMVATHLDFSLKYGMEAIEVDPALAELGEAVCGEMGKRC